MIVLSTAIINGRAYELSLEPLFDRDGNLRDVKCHMFRDVPNQQQSTADDRQAEMALQLVG